MYRLNRPRMILATHTPELTRACNDFLTTRGYDMQDIQEPKGDSEWRVIPTDSDGVERFAGNC